MTWLSLIFLCLIALLVLRPNYKTFGQVAVFGMGAKLFAGIAYGILFKYYYGGGDTWNLWAQVEAFNHQYATSFIDYFQAIFSPIDPYSGNPRSVFFMRTISPFALFSGHNYWVVSCYFSLFSFWATWRFIDVLSKIFEAYRHWIILVLGFLPSFLFWSSGITKETLANGSLFYLLGVVLSLYSGGKLRYRQGILFLLWFFILFMIRHYLAGVFTFTAISVLIDRFLPFRVYWARILSFFLIMAFGLFFIRFFYVRLRPERFPITFYELHEQIKEQSSPDGMIQFHLAPTWKSVFSNLPKSTFAGLFRPLPGDHGGLWAIFIILENSILLIALLLTFLHYKKIQWRHPLILYALVFVLVLASILPLTTPNFGSLVRYKSSYMPLLFLVFSALPYHVYLRKHIRML